MLTRTNLRLGEFDDFQILALPYRSGNMELIVFLPREADGLKPLERRLTASGIKLWMSDLETKDVQLYLPRWEMTQNHNLITALERLGLSAPFRSGGFTKNLGGGAFIGDVIHGTAFAVDEEGVTAAAGTAVHFKKGGLKPEQAIVRVDRPFLFMVRNSNSGAILFLGRVVDPR
jgi:serpin B